MKSRIRFIALIVLLTLSTDHLAASITAAPTTAPVLFVSDFGGNVILRVDPTTGTPTQFSPPPNTPNLISSPQGLLFGPDGNLYVANFGVDQILRIDPTTGAQTVISPPPSTPNLLTNNPFDLVFGNDGNLYVTVFNGDRIVRVDPTTGAQTQVSPPPNTPNNLLNPEGLTLGPDGNLYVGNSRGGNVIRVDPTTGAQTIIYADDPNVLAPSGVRFGSDRKLYVANHRSNVIRLNNPTATDTTTITPTQVTSAGSGVLHSGPLSLSFGSDGLYYSTHLFANRITRINNPTATDTSTITQTVISSDPSFSELGGVEFKGATLGKLYLPLILK